MRPPPDSSRSATRVALALLAGIAWASTGCTAGPTLPIPPPAVQALSVPDADGFVTVSGTASPDVFVGCINSETREGVIAPTDADGRFSFRIRADVGDTLLLFQLTDDGRGTPVERIVGGPPPDGGM